MLSGRIDTVVADVSENKSAIQTEAQARAAADSAEAQARQTLGAQVEANKSAIETINKTYADDKIAEAYSQRIIQAQLKELSDSALQNAVNDAEGQAESRRAVAQVREELYANIDEANKASAGYRLELLTLINENDAQYQNDIQAVATDLDAEISARETLAVKVGQNTSAIQTEAQTRAAADSAEAQARQTLGTQVAANKSAIETINKTRADDKTAEAYSQRIIQAQLKELSDSALQNAVNDAEGQEQSRKAVAQVREELYANIDEANKASAGYRLELLTLINENDAQYQNDIEAVATDLDAEISARETLAVKVGQNTSAIQTEAQARADSDSGLADRIFTVAAGVGENKAAIQNETHARIQADDALASGIDIVQANVDINSAAIRTETTARATADQALSGRIDTVVASVGENTSAIQTEATTRAAADSAEAQARQTLGTQVAANKSAIETINKTRTDDKTAEAYSQRIIQAQLKELSDSALQNAVNDAEGQEQSRKAVAQVREELYANIDEANKASAGYRLELLTAIDENDAKYQNSIQAITTNLNAEISARQTLQSTVAGHTTSIESLNEVKSGIVGKHLLKVDTNGYVAGYELYNGGDSKSSFTIAADKFLISRPGVKDPKQIFVYDSASGALALKNLIADGAIIKEATITKLKIGNNELSSIASAYSNSKITYEWPRISAASIGGAVGPIGAAVPDGLLIAYETDVGGKYYFNSSFTINFISSYIYSSNIDGICYSYIRVNPNTGSYTTLAGPCTRARYLFSGENPSITIPFSAQFEASTSGIAYYAIMIGFYTTSGYFVNTRGVDGATIGINIGPCYLNAITLYR